MLKCSNLCALKIVVRLFTVQNSQPFVASWLLMSPSYHLELGGLEGSSLVFPSIRSMGKAPIISAMLDLDFLREGGRRSEQGESLAGSALAEDGCGLFR